MDRESTKYNVIVNYEEETKTITVLGEIFKYKDGFKGATGTKFEIVSLSDFEEQIEPYEDNDKELLIYMAENFGDLNREMIEGVDSSREALKNLFYDLSYENIWDYLREELNLSDHEAYIFNCIGGGRCFNSNFEGNVNTHLHQLIREAETK